MALSCFLRLCFEIFFNRFFFTEPMGNHPCFSLRHPDPFDSYLTHFSENSLSPAVCNTRTRG